MTKKDDDFGFSIVFHDEKEIPLEEIDALVKFKDESLAELRAMIMPFLQKLANNKGDVIKWPDRQKQVSEFMKRIDTFTDNAIIRKRGFSKTDGI